MGKRPFRQFCVCAADRTLRIAQLFVEKVRDIVGLYLDPSILAMDLCSDEKSRIHALDRTQPLLPLAPDVRL